MERSVLDTQHSHAVIARMLRAQRASVLKGEYTAGQILSLMGKFDFALGMRLHFLMFAAIQGTPFVALPYAGKVSGFLEALGLPVPPLNLVNAGRLIAYLDESWDRRRSMRTQIAQALPALQERARETHRILLEVLTGQKIADAHAKAA
jgi:polysaccharide pyruvyl transferase WcaK-like protein